MRPISFRFVSSLAALATRMSPRTVFRGAAFASFGLAVISACGTGTTTGNSYSTDTGSTTTTVIYQTSTYTTTQTSTLQDGAVVTSTSTGTTVISTTSTLTNTSNTGTSGSSNTGSTGTNTSTTSPSGSGSTSSTSSGAKDGGGCANTNTSQINLDSTGWVCNNQWAIQGAWYCYNDGSDSTNSCKGSDGKGQGAVPWNASQNAMCLSGSIASGGFAGIGIKLDQPSQADASFTTWNANAHNIIGFAVTFTGTSGGSVLYLEYPTTNDQDPQTKDAPGLTVPGVSNGSVTYNALFSDAILANNVNHANTVDPTMVTDLKVTIPPDTNSRTYNFCITKIVPIMAAPNPEVPTGNFGPAWTNMKAQAVNGVNGYAVQSAPFLTNGEGMSMQVTGGTSSGDVGFVYTPSSSFQSNGNAPGAFPAIISGWGPGEAGIQFYGPYKGGKTISALQSVTTAWSFSMGGAGDAAYDVWFGQSANPTQPNVELMVWVGYSGKMPLGSNKATFNGYQVWYGQSNSTGQQVVSYYPTSSANSTPASFDLLPFFKNAATNGYAGLSTGSYLLGVQAGFEVYSGGGTWTTSNYNLSIK